MTYSYTDRGRGTYRIRAEGVVVDTAAERLLLTATHDHAADPVRAEFPLILARICDKCGNPVAVYAKGSLTAFCRATAPGIFDSPWERAPGWKRLETPGGFALIATGGHNFTWSDGRLAPHCTENQMRTITTPLVDVAVRPPRPKPPPKPRRQTPAAPAPRPATPSPPETLPPQPQSAPLRTQMSFGW